MNSRKPRLLDRDALTNYALRVLAGRSYAIAELRGKLQRKAADAADVEPVLAKLKEAGYLDDRRFAESYAAARRDNEGFGRMRVVRDLRQRRVAPQVAERAVAAAFAETDEAAMIERFLKRKYRSVSLADFLAEDKNLASAYRRLRLAGFSSSASVRVLKRFAERAEELEDSE
jgi:regulatory protein